MDKAAGALSRAGFRLMLIILPFQGMVSRFTSIGGVRVGAGGESPVTASERQMKALLLRDLLARHGHAHCRRSAIVNEFVLGGFSGRADLSVVNDEISVFEIKSDADDLSRLRDQLKLFRDCCNWLHVVTTARHIDRVMRMVSGDISVLLVDRSGRITVRQGGSCRKIRSKRRLASLVAARELRRILSSSGRKGPFRQRCEMEEEARNLSLECLRKAVLAAIVRRYRATTDAFLDAVGNDGGIVAPEHLDRLRRHPPGVCQSGESRLKVECDDPFLLHLAREYEGAGRCLCEPWRPPPFSPATSPARRSAHDPGGSKSACEGEC